MPNHVPFAFELSMANRMKSKPKPFKFFDCFYELRVIHSFPCEGRQITHCGAGNGCEPFARMAPASRFFQ